MFFSKAPLRDGICHVRLLAHAAFIALLLLYKTLALAADADKPLLFLGNKNLVPVVYLDDGRPAGLAVDLLRAIEPIIGHPLTLDCMDWATAQERVARGEADALLQINYTKERAKIYDFSEPLLQSQFSIFTRSSTAGITGIASLRGLKVGVEQGGLPQLILQEEPLVRLEIVPDFLEGFHRLAAGDLDAVVVDYRVGAHVVAEHRIAGLKVSGQPIAYSQSAIAVKKGNAQLLAAINRGLDQIRRDGTYDRIVSQWEPQEGVFLTRGEMTYRIQVAVIVGLLLLCLVAAVWMAILYRELRRRRSAEERWRLVFENSPVSLWEEDFSAIRSEFENLRRQGVTDLDSHFEKYPDTVRKFAELVGIVDMNEAALLLHGAASKGQLFAGLLDTLTAESLETFRLELLALWQGETRMVRDTAVKTLAGEVRNVTVHMAVCPGYEESLAKVLVCLSDITDRKSAERELALLNCAVNRSHDPVYLVDAEFRLRYVNDAAVRALGYSRGELLASRVTDIDPDIDPEALRTMLQAKAEGAFLGAVETHHRAKDGRLFPVEIVSSPFDYDGETLFLSVAHDVTERKRAEEALSQRERQYQTLVENIPDLIVRYDTDLRRTYVNPAWEAASGLSADEVIDVRIEEIPKVPQPVIGEYAKALRRAMATGTRQEIEFNWGNSRGETLYLQYVVVPECEAGGKVVSLLAVGRDITALKTAERQLRDSCELLQELAARRDCAREEERSRIAREIHDELGQLLTALRMGIATIGFEFGQGHPGLKERVGELTALTDQTIKEVRNIAAALRPAILDSGIVAALEWLATEFQSHAKTVCRLDLVQPLPKLDDYQAVALFRIVQESLTNIARYAEARSVVVSLTDGHNACHLEISDDGRGFDPDAPRHGSFGLIGMRERALMLRGELSIRSAPGAGTTIKLTFPLNDSKETP